MLSNTIVFCLLIFIAWFSKSFFKCFPKVFHTVICWVGIYAIFDPFLTLFFDICSSNWENGDLFKFGWHFNEIYETPTVGVYMIILTVFATTLLTTIIFYRWMVRYYMNGKILDLYRRLSGHLKDFFVPYDNEVSLSYL